MPLLSVRLSSVFLYIVINTSFLFDKVYGPGSVNNEKDFKARVKSEAEVQFVRESDRMLKNDVVNYFISKLKLDMPNNFLKRWLVKTSEQPITMEMLEKEYDMYSKSLQWQLIENRILENYKIKVTEKDVVEHAKKLIEIQMKQYGQAEGDDSQLTDIANNILKNEYKISIPKYKAFYFESFYLIESSIFEC